ncbi:type II secretion system protein N [Chromatiaceae bacterium AAb-1]|nr:type II secretion system protein N [Chromatiaceae bacterium AAb-1]
MKYWKLFASGIFSYLIFMLFLTPAAWWLKLVSLPADVRLGQVSGTLWRGEVAVVQYQQLQLQTLRWQLNGWALFSGKLKLALQSGSMQQTQQPYLNAHISYSLNGIQVQNSLLRLPVSQLIPLLQLPLPVQATGELMLDIRDYQYGAPWCDTLSGAANWLDARLQPPGSNWLDLQSVYADLSCQEGEPLLTTDGQNALGLAITARLNQAGKLSVDGTVKPEASMPQEVHQAMKFIGQPDAEGRYSIRF